MNRVSSTVGRRDVERGLPVDGCGEDVGGVVAVAVPEADERERNGGNALQPRMLVDTPTKFLGECDVLAQVVAQAARAVAAQHPPQLQRPEATAERHVPVAVVDDLAGLAGCVAR